MTKSLETLRGEMLEAQSAYFSALESAIDSKPGPVIDPVDPVDPVDPPPMGLPGKTVFLWLSDMAIPAGYEKWAGEHNQRRGQNRIFRLGDTATIWGTEFFEPLRWPSAQAGVAEVTETHIDHRGHTEWVFWNDLMQANSYLQMDQTLRVRLQCKVETVERAKGDGYISLFQCWGPSYEGHSGDGGWRNPPFALMTLRGEWRIQLLGAPEFSDRSDWIDRSKHFGEVDGEWHTWHITYKPSLTEGACAVTLDDGEPAFLAVGGPTAIKPKATREGWGPQPRVGCYTSPSSNPARILYRQIMATIED